MLLNVDNGNFCHQVYNAINNFYMEVKVKTIRNNCVEATKT